MKALAQRGLVEDVRYDLWKGYRLTEAGIEAARGLAHDCGDLDFDVLAAGR